MNDSTLKYSHKTAFQLLKAGEIFTETKFDSLPKKMGYLKLNESTSDGKNTVIIKTGELIKFPSDWIVYIYS